MSKSYDYLNRLASITTAPSRATAFGYAYRYNDANQRVQVTLSDSAFWVYEYDAPGQVRTGKRYWKDWTPVAGEQYEYSFDDIGNRASTRVGGDATGLSLRSAFYSANALNQYTSRSVPGTVDVLGIANMAATVTVGGQATYRRGEFFQKAVSISNGSSPAYQAVTTMAVNGSSSNTVTGNILLSAATENYYVDLDGNTTQDGLWTYTWNGENRLITMQSLSSVPTAGKRKLAFEYDSRGRRISKIVWTTSDGVNYISPVTTKFVYDGWNLIGEFDSTNNRIRSYCWGSDLSGSMQGAGGVGGLVEVTPASGINYFPAFDGNGNVTAYVDGSGGITAQLEYGPFGEVIRATSSINPAIPMRWSGKYTDLETDLVYYGRRYYNPSTGRFLSRDPLGDEAFHKSQVQLDPNRTKEQPKHSGKRRLKASQLQYVFVSNDPLNSVDAYGLDVYKVEFSADLAVVGSSVNHREIVGDDGNGGTYVLSFNQSPECGCHILGASVAGRGHVDVRKYPGSAADWIKDNGATIKATVTTPDPAVDKSLTALADYMGEHDPFYLLLFNDCGSIANDFIKAANAGVKQWNDKVDQQYFQNFWQTWTP